MVFEAVLNVALDNRNNFMCRCERTLTYGKQPPHVKRTRIYGKKPNECRTTLISMNSVFKANKVLAIYS